jgi:preprotein translocase subunit Sec61beta
MASRRRKKKGAPMPQQSAGLLRFFEEETEGIKMRPELLMAFAVGLIVIAILAHLQALGMLHF